jgi:hypothetical protein
VIPFVPGVPQAVLVLFKIGRCEKPSTLIGNHDRCIFRLVTFARARY